MDFRSAAAKSCADHICKVNNRLKRLFVGVSSLLVSSLRFLFASFFDFDPDFHGMAWSVWRRSLWMTERRWRARIEHFARSPGWLYVVQQRSRKRRKRLKRPSLTCRSPEMRLAFFISRWHLPQRQGMGYKGRLTTVSRSLSSCGPKT